MHGLPKRHPVYRRIFGQDTLSTQKKSKHLDPNCPGCKLTRRMWDEQARLHEGLVRFIQISENARRLLAPHAAEASVVGAWAEWGSAIEVARHLTQLARECLIDEIPWTGPPDNYEQRRD